MRPRYITMRELRRQATGRVSKHRRPTTRADCEDTARPCPYVGCRHHLYLDVLASGTISLRWPDREPEELEQTCALDVVDANPCGLTLDAIGRLMNYTRERARQLEASGLICARERATDLT